MTVEWQKEVDPLDSLLYKEGHLNEGMTMEWQKSRSPCLFIIQEMILEWQNDNWMTE